MTPSRPANDCCVTLVRGLGAPFLLVPPLGRWCPRPQKSFMMTTTVGWGWEDLVISTKIAIGKGNQRMAVIVSEGQEAYSLDRISIQPSQ